MTWATRKRQLRDQVAAGIATAIPTLTGVYPVVAPLYKPEDLYKKPAQVPVWIAGVSAENLQGPDWNTTTLGVGTVGLTFDAEGYSLTDQSLRTQELAAADALDDVLSEILALFTPSLDRTLYVLADFRFQDVTQPIQMDTTLYRENGVWFSAIFLTYLDQLDDESAV